MICPLPFPGVFPVHPLCCAGHWGLRDVGVHVPSAGPIIAWCHPARGRGGGSVRAVCQAASKDGASCARQDDGGACARVCGCGGGGCGPVCVSAVHLYPQPSLLPLGTPYNHKSMWRGVLGSVFGVVCREFIVSMNGWHDKPTSPTLAHPTYQAPVACTPSMPALNERWISPLPRGRLCFSRCI
jgi:hypothetical protein